MAAGNWKDMVSAINQDNIDLVKYHLKEGVDPNYQHPEFMTTPLIESITLEKYEIAKLLLENGADPSLSAGFSQDSPILVARKIKNFQMIQLVESYLPKKKNFFLLWKDKIWEKSKMVIGNM